MQPFWNFVQSLQFNAYVREAGRLSVFMMIGGLCGLYLRVLYIRFGQSVGNRRGMGANFPLLIITTVLVIFVVKSSLALSLGLVGALSIVRFRAAIKEPEELVVLFFCIAVGLALGAEYPELAIAGVVFFTIFLLIRHRLGGTGSGDTLLLTVTGPRSTLLDGDPERLMNTIRESLGDFTLQRLDIEDGQVQFRAVVAPDEPDKLIVTIEKLRASLPGCSVSCVNLAHLL